MTGPTGPAKGVGPPHDERIAALMTRRTGGRRTGVAGVRALCGTLGDPHRAYEVVHVTGTNGKTTVARMVGAILHASGRRVGTYTSPHLEDVRERIRLGGEPIDPDRFAAATAAVCARLPAVEARLGRPVAFFEALTVIAACIFRAAAVDTAVVEVGIGGRRDATNVHDGAVAVLGRVGRDHPEIGAGAAAVAHEKAGILRPGAPAVVAAQPPDAERVIAAVAARLGTPLLRAGRDFGVALRRVTPDGQELVLHSRDRRFAVHLPLHGAHQADNAACALAAADALLADRGGIEAAAVRAGFAGLRPEGRFEVVPRAGAATVVLDGAHNPEAAQALVAGLAEAFPGRRVLAILGANAGKDHAGLVGTVLGAAALAILTRSPDRAAVPPEELAAVARRAGHEVIPVSDVASALALADRLAAPRDVLVVTGSLYLVGAARALLGAEGSTTSRQPDRVAS